MKFWRRLQTYCGRATAFRTFCYANEINFL